MHRLSSHRIPKGFRGKSKLYVQLWWFVQAIFIGPSPQVFYGWRRFWLRLFGARIGKKVLIRPSVKITYPWKVFIGDYSWIGDNVVLYSLGEIEIGSNTVISQKSYLCTGSHNYNKKTFDIFAKKITVGNGCWLATDVFVAPGINIGDGAVIGARSSVFKNIEINTINIGSPTKHIGNRTNA
ncbi:MAG: colanic acid biosynthesis acetyltransferase WcaF [Legionellales bacterium]|nr:colanic acid biosynthesis acetyltransferase WcaF [Legionellales bacterium]|tara:strand:- start:70 stop:615 length:546 start_codon:yes stop_codon:yes gene_type:complete